MKKIGLLLVIFLFLMVLCSCEKSDSDVCNHDLVHHDGKDPTCTETGYKSYDTCTRCDYTTYEEIPALGHKESSVVIENNILPTCTTKGSYDEVIYCSVCEEKLSRVHKEVEALGHDFGDWTMVYDSTFTTTGLEQRICSRCGATETRQIEQKFATISFDLNGGISSKTIEPIQIHELNKNDFVFDLTNGKLKFKGWSYNGVLVFDKDGILVNSVELQGEMTFKAEFAEEVTLTIFYTLYNL